MYFVIRNSDGDTRIEMLSGDELEKRLNEAYYGEDIQFLGTIPTRDTNQWPERAVLVIRGAIATPHAEQVVTRFRLD